MSRARLGTRRILNFAPITTGVWPFNPVDGNLVLNGTSTTLSGSLYTYKNISLTNGATLYINGQVVIGFTGSFTLDGTSAINGILNQSGNGYDGSGNPSSYTYSGTAPDGTVYSYTVTGAMGGEGGDDGAGNQGGVTGYGFGGGGQASGETATQAYLGTSGEGSGNDSGTALSPGTVGWDTLGPSGGSAPDDSADGGAGGSGAGAGTASWVLFLKGGSKCSIISAAGTINFSGNPGKNGGNAGNGDNANPCDNAGGGGASAGGAGGYVYVKLPSSMTAAFNPTVKVSGGASAAGGAGGTNNFTSPAGGAGGNSSAGQSGTYVLVGY